MRGDDAPVRDQPLPRAYLAPPDALLSYTYSRTARAQRRLRDGHGLGMRIIGDSGAYSAMSQGEPIRLKDYAAWLVDFQRYHCWSASLDVIGDFGSSWANWMRLREADIITVPTIHFGAPADLIDGYVRHGADLIGLGGMVGVRTSLARPWAAHVMAYAAKEHPQVRFHGWGVSSVEMMAHLPFWSVDSSTFNTNCRYGRMRLWDPDNRRITVVHLNGVHAGKYGRLLRTHYGLTPAEARDSGPHNSTMHALISFLSCQRQAEFFQGRHNVSPPSGQKVVGTRMHFASTDISITWRAAIDALRRQQERESA